MKLSIDRQNFLSSVILKDILQAGSVQADSKEILLDQIKKALSLFVQEWAEIEHSAESKVAGIKRGITPGSAEWDTLYDRFFEEIFRKKSSLFTKK